MRWIILTLLMILSLVLESTVFRTLTIGGAQPDLVLVLITFFSLFSGSHGGAFFGFLGGLAQDALTGQFLGLNALTKMTIGYTVARVERNVYRDRALIPMLLVAILTLLNQGLVYLIMAIFTPMPSFFSLLFSVIIPSMVGNCIIALLTYNRFRHSVTKGWLKNVEY